MSSANNMQVGGTHYRSQIQHWDMVAANQLGYFEAQVTKYVTRCRKKNGRQDVEKGLHFLDKLIELAREGKACPVQTHNHHESFTVRRRQLVGVTEYAEANELSGWEALVVGLILSWSESGSIGSLIEARGLIAAHLEKGADATSAYVNQG